MDLVVRKIRPNEMRDFLEAHRAAIRITAAPFYPPAVIEAWAPWPITDAHIEQAAADTEELRIVALSGGSLVGFGALVLHLSELRACYVHPKAGRRGVGRAIVGELEDMARAARLKRLHLDSSLAAEQFYRGLGYEEVERGSHVLSTGVAMDCVRMTKDL